MNPIHTLSIDIETYSDVDLGKAGLYKYAQSPAFAILLFAYSYDGGPVQVIDLTGPDAALHGALVNALRDPCVRKQAYNASFEWYCLSRHLGLTDEETSDWAEQWHCTMLHGQYCGLPAGLGAVGAAMGLPQDKQKNSVGKSLITYFCKPCKPTKTNGRRTRNLPHHDPEKWALFIDYNRQDVVAEMEIERRLSGFPVPEDVQRQWVLDQRINLRGVAVDLDLVDAALAMDAVNSDMLVREAQQISGLENPNSVAQLRRWLEKELDEEVADLRKDTVTDLLGRDLPNEDVTRILEIRRDLGKASNKKYVAMAAAAGADGRLRGMMQFYGANRTGREAGRIVQPQNLPHDTVDHEDLARDLVKSRDRGAVQWAYGSVPHTLSALIRTALVAGPGCVFVDADFSAIEARVIAWLAGEQWVLDVFRTHGKIYEATASQMFGIPMDLIKKGNPEYAYRAKGKVATLALGYQGGPNALINMGALRSGIPEEELPDIVRRWRDSNPAIRRFWWAVEEAAKKAAYEGKPAVVPISGVQALIFMREVDPDNGLDFLTIQLPSGRKLYYANPHMGQNRFGNPSLCYWGQNGTSKKWVVTETYGGKLAENCLAGDTRVLTHRGLVPIAKVQPEDLVWDGFAWVHHNGVVYQGRWPTIGIDGLRMTPDHKIMTTEGWVKSGEADRLNWEPVRSPDCSRARAKQRPGESPMALPLRLWKINDPCSRGPQEGRREAILRVHEEPIHFREPENARDDQPSGIRRMALHEAEMHGANAPGLEELRRSRDHRVRPVAEQLRELLDRRGPDVQTRTGPGPDRQRQGLLPGKLPLGDQKGQYPEPEANRVHGLPSRAQDGSRTGRNGRYRAIYHHVQDRARLAGRITVDPAERPESVYDLRDCGPRNQFCVFDPSTHRLRLVHNCTQAVARDCLFFAMENLTAAGYRVVFDVHDEVVLEVPEGKADLADVVRIMSQSPPWAPDLPLNADGWINPFFHKD